MEESTKMVFEEPPLKALNDLLLATVFLPFAAFNWFSISWQVFQLSKIEKLTSKCYDIIYCKRALFANCKCCQCGEQLLH